MIKENCLRIKNSRNNILISLNNNTSFEEITLSIEDFNLNSSIEIEFCGNYKITATINDSETKCCILNKKYVELII